MKTPPTKEEIDRLTEYTNFAIDLANEVMKPQTPLKYPTISFDLIGRAAGRAWYRKNHIQYNIGIFRAQTAAFLERTTSHEVCHLVAFALYGSLGLGHGRYWKHVMTKMGQEPSRCHSYDVPDSALRVPRPYVYKCGCKEFKLTANIHNKVKNGQRRHCTKCKISISFVRMVESN